MSPFSSSSSRSQPASTPHALSHPDLLDPDLPDADQDLFLPGPSRRTPSIASGSGPGSQNITDGKTRDLRIDGDAREETAMRKEGWSSTFHTTTNDPSTTSSKIKGKGKQRASSNDLTGTVDVGNGDDIEPLVGPLGAKALASITGAVTTSLLMTPFDVLKTRLQTNLPRSSSASGPSFPPSLGNTRPGGSSGLGTGVSARAAETVCCQTAVLPEVPGGGGRGGVGSASGMGQEVAGGVRSACLSSTKSGGTSGIGSSSINPISGSTTTTTDPKSFFRRFLPNAQASSSSLIPSFISTTSSSSLASSSGPGSATLHLPTSAPAGCLHPSKWTGIWGEAGSGSGSAAITLREAQGLLEDAQRVARGTMMDGAQGQGQGSRGFFSEIGVVMREGQGVKGLWKGVGTSLTMSIPSASLYMIGYEHLLTILTPMISPTPSPPTVNSPSSTFSTPAPPTSTSQPYFTPAPFVAGSLARTLSATVISPMELFRVRLQALPAAGQPSPTYKSTFDSIVLMVKGQGVRALWRGLGPTLWRDVPFSGAYWANFEILKKYLTESGTLEPGLRMTFISGATSGTIASVITSPFDVLKTRRQAFTPSASCSPAAVSHPASTLPLLLHIIETEGWRALFAGIVPRTAKIAPACGIMIGCYEGVGRYLGGKQGGRL